MNSNDVRREWAERSGEYSPDYYAYYDPDEKSELVRDYCDSFVEPDAAVLELGCSSGRHLSHLLEHGYENLHGIDVNDDALTVMKQNYPDLAERGTFHVDAIENVVGEFDDGRFDVVYSVETLQHIHPDDEWVFDEVVRIADDLLMTSEVEGDDEYESADEFGVNYVNGEFPLYYRNWRHVFEERGSVEVDSESLRRDTFRAFRPTGE